jgi:hypothetical protein
MIECRMKCLEDGAPLAGQAETRQMNSRACGEQIPAILRERPATLRSMEN